GGRLVQCHSWKLVDGLATIMGNAARAAHARRNAFPPGDALLFSRLTGNMPFTAGRASIDYYFLTGSN
ncbi:hypothetical protein, partial [Thiolapillus sp.]|uniref:hypothetical protein n=1 Tax=Thiolapillus sp. TaxID=2017437 RepID=UPI0025D8FB3E